jgi:hypothetical protein
MSDKWSTIGWQGISLTAPPDWNLVAFSGEENKGYLRVDSPELTAIEVRWESLKEAPDIDARINSFLDSLSAAAKKRKLKFSSRVKSRKLTKTENVHGGDSVGFTWKSDRQAYGRMLYCGYCKRLIIGQVVCGPKEDLSGLSSRVLTSICQHEEPGWNVWGLYDLAVPVPENMKLKRQSLMAGFVELEFGAKRERLLIQRWGLAANTVLKNVGFEKWLDGSYLTGIQGYKFTRTPLTDEHAGVTFKGVRQGIHRAIMSVPKGLVGKPMPRAIDGCAWYCDTSNKIYAVRHYHSGSGDLGTVLREKIACH